MPEITVGQTYQLKPTSPRGKPVTANITAITRRGLGHTVAYKVDNKVHHCSMGNFKNRLVS